MTLLLLAGTEEARALAHALDERGLDAVVSLAGATRRPADHRLHTRMGGFGGADGFAAYLRDAGIDRVVNAVHPFAARITARTAAICMEVGVPVLRLERRGWLAGPGDDWSWCDTLAEAADAILAGDRVFLATGRQSLPEARALSHAMLFLRVIDAPMNPFPYPYGAFVTGRPPFDVSDEAALFRRLRIDRLITKDSGGTGGRTKLDAARDLGIPVTMLRRPPSPTMDRVETVDEALAWIGGV